MKKIFLKKIIMVSLFFSSFLNLPFFTQNKLLAASITSLKNPLTSSGKAITTSAIFGRFYKVFLGTIIFISLLMFLWGGFQYMTADGKGEKTSKAQQTMVWAVLGIAASFLAYTVINTIFGYIVF